MSKLHGLNEAVCVKHNTVTQYKVPAVIIVVAIIIAISDTGLRVTASGIGGKFMWGDIQQRDTSLCGLRAAALMVCPNALLQGVKEGGQKPRSAQTADKAGWIKKSSGGFLGLWKDRYLLLCQAQLLVYENEVRTGLLLSLSVLRWGGK